MLLKSNRAMAGGFLPALADPTPDILALSGLVAWFAPRRGSVTLDASGRVSQWRPMVAGAGVLAARDAANRPAWVTDPIGGGGCAYFDGARADVLDWAGALLTGSAAAQSIWLIATVASTGATRKALAGRDISAASGRVLLTYDDNDVTARVGGDDSQVSWTRTAKPTLFGLLHDAVADTLVVYADGATQSTANTNTVATGAFSLGHTATSGQEPTMWVHDVLIFNTAATTPAATLQAYADAYSA